MVIEQLVLIIALNTDQGLDLEPLVEFDRHNEQEKVVLDASCNLHESIPCRCFVIVIQETAIVPKSPDVHVVLVVRIQKELGGDQSGVRY